MQFVPKLLSRLGVANTYIITKLLEGHRVQPNNLDSNNAYEVRWPSVDFVFSSEVDDDVEIIYFYISAERNLISQFFARQLCMKLTYPGGRIVEFTAPLDWPDGMYDQDDASTLCVEYVVQQAAQGWSVAQFSFVDS